MTERQNTLKRLSHVRSSLIKSFPFFSRLLLRLSFGLGEIGTAGTDGKVIVFDSEFLHRLSDPELEFVILHEIYHVILRHVSRGKKHSENRIMYNVACDIVVNSLILEQLHLGSGFEVAGETVMHTTPCGEEGYLYTADEVYAMLADLRGSRGRDPCIGSFHLVDSHEGWDTSKIQEAVLQHDITDILQRMKGCGYTNNRLIRHLEHTRTDGNLDWRKALRIFASSVKQSDEDFSYRRPDRRFLQCDFIVPGWTDEDVKRSSYNLLEFFVDVSGSILDEELTLYMDEIRRCLKQVQIQGELCFFDTAIIQKIPVSSETDIDISEVFGSGGTSFQCIFDYVKQMRKRPRGIVILTDGYASFPKWEEVMSLPPVLWIITSSDINPPWGHYVALNGSP